MKQVFNITVPARGVGYGDNKRILPAFGAKVVLDIDLDAVANTLGAKAARAKSRRSVGLSGLVKVTYIRPR